MERIVILKNADRETPDDYFLETCLALLFPECEIEIRFSNTTKKEGKKPSPRKNQAQRRHKTKKGGGTNV